MNTKILEDANPFGTLRQATFAAYCEKNGVKRMPVLVFTWRGSGYDKKLRSFEKPTAMELKSLGNSNIKIKLNEANVYRSYCTDMYVKTVHDYHWNRYEQHLYCLIETPSKDSIEIRSKYVMPWNSETSDIQIQQDKKSINPDFYTAWLFPNIDSCKNEQDQISRIRTKTFYSKDEVLQWIRDNKRENDLVIPPVRYSYSDQAGKYRPDAGSETVDTYFAGSIAPYRQHVMIRTEPRSPAEQRELERRITDPAYRAQIRSGWNEYNRSGRREELAAQKSPEDMALSAERSRRRLKLRDDVAKHFYPELFDQWKHGKTQDIRNQARQELAAKLDFTQNKDETVQARLRQWRNFYDRYSARRSTALKKAKDAYAAGDNDKLQSAIDEYNGICDQFHQESANSDVLFQLLSTETGEFDQKTYDQLVADMKNLHAGQMTESQRQILYWAHMLDECGLNEAQMHGLNPKYQRLIPDASISDEEFDWIAEQLGTTENFQDVGWILPDGRMLDMKRSEEINWDNSHEIENSKRFEHECIPLPPRIDKICFSRYDISPMQWLMSAGMLRIDASESATVACIKRPTPAQMDRLYDFVDLPWETMRDLYNHRTGITQFALDIGGDQCRAIVYDDVDEFRKRLMNDIRNYT